MNAQPMGFYPPSSLVRDAQRRGVEVRAPHINRSEAQCDIEDGLAVRVGLAYVQSVGEEEAKSVVAQKPYRGLGDLARRAPVRQDVLEALVSAGACDEWGPRRELLWQLGVTPRGETVAGGSRQLTLPLEPTAEIPELPEQTPWERMLADYKHTSLSVGIHPLQLLRPYLPAEILTSADLADTPNGTRIQLAGMAIARQRPATAKGIVFMLLEDEHGQANLIIPSQVYEARRAIIRGEPLILARGKLERHDRNVNLLVSEVSSLGPLARQAAGEAEVTRALPRAHHFGHR
jgi:error-prone DNA polymerase